MTSSGHDEAQRGKQRRDRSDKSPSEQAGARQQEKHPPQPSPTRPASKRPIVFFVVLFGAFLGLFYLIMTQSFLQERVFPAYLEFNAAVSTGIINLLGGDATRVGKAISSAQASIQIRRGCDAIEPTALFVAAVLATPVSRRARFLGVIGGAVLLAMINIARIVTLFYTRIHFPKAFDLMHVEVWQGLFICLSLALWIAWALWATKPVPAKADAAA